MNPTCKSKQENLEEVQQFWDRQRNLSPEEQIESKLAHLQGFIQQLEKSMVGIYGVIAYSVAQRTKELGIRRALGAQQADILRLVLSQTLGLTLGGVAIGIAGAWALTGVMKTMLFGVAATDPSTFIGIGAAFVLAGLAAGYPPARRAVRVDPMAALR